MDWKKVGLKLAQMGLPLMGGLLGGPAGALGGKAAVSLISSALDLEPEKTTPDNVLRLIQANPESLVRLKEAELNNKVEFQRLLVQAEGQRIAAETQQILTVNQTMQAEAKSERWPQYSWRPVNGFAYPLAIILIYFLLPLLGKAVPDVPQWIWVGWLSILGVAVWDRGKEKRTKAGEHKIGLLEGAIKAIRGGKS